MSKRLLLYTFGEKKPEEGQKILVFLAGQVSWGLSAVEVTWATYVVKEWEDVETDPVTGEEVVTAEGVSPFLRLHHSETAFRDDDLWCPVEQIDRLLGLEKEQ